MDLQHFTYLFAVTVGMVSSGIIASAWQLAVGEEPRLGLLLDPNPNLLTPFRVVAIIFSAPTTVLLDAFWWLIERPLFGVPLVLSGLVWSFLQGVFILTQVFGFS